MGYLADEVRIDKGFPNLDFVRDMKKRMPAPAKKKIDYPQETECDRAAAAVRRRANRLTPEQRAEYLRRGMVRIYRSHHSL